MISFALGRNGKRLSGAAAAARGAKAAQAAAAAILNSNGSASDLGQLTQLVGCIPDRPSYFTSYIFSSMV